MKAQWKIAVSGLVVFSVVGVWIVAKPPRQMLNSALGKPSLKSPAIIQLNHLGSVSVAVRMFVEETEGKLPVAISELQRFWGSKSDWERERQFVSPNTGKSADWLYFPERFSESNPTKRIILASPEPMGTLSDLFRVVGWSDGSTSTIPEKEYLEIEARETRGKHGRK